jgi:hypothetical protein
MNTRTERALELHRHQNELREAVQGLERFCAHGSSSPDFGVALHEVLQTLEKGEEKLKEAVTIYDAYVNKQIEHNFIVLGWNSTYNHVSEQARYVLQLDETEIRIGEWLHSQKPNIGSSQFELLSAGEGNLTWSIGERHPFELLSVGEGNLTWSIGERHPHPISPRGCRRLAKEILTAACGYEEDEPQEKTLSWRITFKTANDIVADLSFTIPKNPSLNL